MSVKKFKFVSPGVFVDEIDKSILQESSTRRGPIVIGRAQRGPSMRPTRIESFADFVSTFGNPIPGGAGGDVWRDGNYTSTTYAGYAAQAYLRNNSPITFVRLLGSKHNEVSVGTTPATPGWNTGGHEATGSDAGKGAFGLFLFDSGSTGSAVPGTLGAIWYVNSDTTLTLSGAYAAEPDESTSSVGSLIRSQGDSREFKLQVWTSGSGTGFESTSETISFNFNPDSSKFIRKVFNTNPTLANSSKIAIDQRKSYWLGQSFEGVLDSVETSEGAGGPLDSALTSAGECHGTLLVLETGDVKKNGGNFKRNTAESKTGWVIAQDLGAPGDYAPQNAQKLFRLTTLNAGIWESQNLKVSIQDIAFSNNDIDPFGSFTVVIRASNDTDAQPRILERWEDCNLNLASPNYISRVIGDKYLQWDETERRLREYGTYDNVSKLVRVEVSTAVEAGGDARWLPAGFFGPPRFNSFQYYDTGSVNAGDKSMAKSIDDCALADSTTQLISPTSAGGAFTGSVSFPKYNLRASNSDTTLPGRRSAYFGIETRRSANSRTPDNTIRDLARTMPAVLNGWDADDDYTENSFVFSLDDISGSADYAPATDTTRNVLYVSGSRKDETSITATGSIGNVSAEASFKGLIEDLEVNRFTMPLFGGFDGFDITERAPLGNDLILSTDRTSFVHNTYKRAIDMIQDTDNLDVNLAVVPGLTNATLTRRLIDNCEERADALAIIDLENDYTPVYEEISSNTESDRVGTVDQAVSTLKDRNINSSYGCAYYPWVLVRDTATTGQTIWMPPSVVALGVLGNSETQGELWFAPAGFNRGGLTEGDSGLTVVGVRQKLSSKDRDKLYNQHINPIASFPAEGVVVFGQKTLQLTASALDRINVRRLMIFLKKEISFAASRILFDQNVPTTWARFKSQVEPFLSDVQSRFGLTDYKLVLDETTTTPDLVDRNVLYAKIFVKPARAIEYIALDFIITATGASFEE